MKIKKYTSYILILLVVVGLFVPLLPVHVSAQDDCYTQTLNRNGDGNSQRALSECDNSSSSQGFGCELGSRPKLQHLFRYVTCIISTSVIPLIFALAVTMFVWGVVQYVINSSEEVKKEKGKQFMIWGIIALTVMVSVWGLVSVLGNTFGVNTGIIPQVKSP